MSEVILEFRLAIWIHSSYLPYCKVYRYHVFTQFSIVENSSKASREFIHYGIDIPHVKNHLHYKKLKYMQKVFSKSFMTSKPYNRIFL